MFGASASPGEIAGVVIIVAVFLLLGIFVCGCGPLPQPTEIAAQRWRERKERTARRREERARQRETELPFHSGIRPGRAIHFADERIGNPNAPAPPPRSPPPAGRPRNRSPQPQQSAEAEQSESDTASVSTQSRSVVEQDIGDGFEKDEPNEAKATDTTHPVSTLMTEKNNSSSESTISVPPPVYSDAVAKESSHVS